MVRSLFVVRRALAPSALAACFLARHLSLCIIGMVLWSQVLISCFDLVISILHFPSCTGYLCIWYDTTGGYLISPFLRLRRLISVIDNKKKIIWKNLKNCSKIRLLCIYRPSPSSFFLSADYDLHLSFAIYLDLLRCFQLVASDGACDLILIASSFNLRYRSSLREGRENYFLFFDLGFFPVESDRWCIELWLATWRACSMGTGVDFVLLEKGEDCLRVIWTRTFLLSPTLWLIFFFFLPRFPYSSFQFSFIGVFLLLGRDGFHICFYQGSRGGNDTRLHCLGTVEIIWDVLSVLSVCVFFTGLFLYIGLFGGEWVIRDTHYFLATGICGWLGLVASETMGCGVVLCLKSISWGSFSRGIIPESIDHMRWKWYFFFSLLFITGCLSWLFRFLIMSSSFLWLLIHYHSLRSCLRFSFDSFGSSDFSILFDKV